MILAALCAGTASAELPSEPARILATFPHDTSAFTEGLLVRDGWLYESTGYDGQSFIRRKDLATGRVIESVKIPPGLFGEGIVDWGDKLYSVTWHGGQGFVWNLDGLSKAGEWHYDGEGWAMTRDAHRIILSDGTPVLRFLDPATLKVVGRLKVTAEGKPIDQINELEYVHGEILANIWQTAYIARIDPRTGHVKGWIDLRGLWDKAGTTGADAVPNGIAYDHATDRLYVTGKDWRLLFQIALPGHRG